MKKFLVLILVVFAFANVAFAESLTLKNQTPYPNTKGTRMAVQWAVSAREVNDANEAMIHGYPLNPASLLTVAKKGTITLNVPERAEYYRVLVWTKGEDNPDLLTNWVDIEPNKTYTLKKDQLIPAVLMLGTGC